MASSPCASAKMRAIQVIEGDAKPRLTTIDRPTPGPGEILVRIAACGLNFADLLMLDGTYQDCPVLPFTLGMEVAGVIEASGTGVTGFSPGDRVAVFGGHGGLAEFGCFPALRAMHLPESVALTTAAGFQITYGTCHLALFHRARLTEGETLLVLGAAGGVGLAAIELGKLAGARVIACARGAARLEIARKAGADQVIDSDTPDLAGAFRNTGGFDVVVDPVGGDQFTAAFRACRPEGRLIPIGFASGIPPRIPANHLLVKNLSVLGVYWGGYHRFQPATIRDGLLQLLEWLDQGKLRPRIGHTLPLGRAAEGLDMLKNRNAVGKVVITIPYGATSGTQVSA